MNISNIHKVLDKGMLAYLEDKPIDRAAVLNAISQVREWTRAIHAEVAVARARNEIPDIPEMRRE